MWEAPRSSLAGSVARAGIRQEIKPQGNLGRESGMKMEPSWGTPADLRQHGNTVGKEQSLKWHHPFETS